MDIIPLKFTDEQKRIWKANFAPDSTPDQWALFIDECERRALIPNTHVVFSLRNASEYDTITNQWITTKKVAFITTINALRLLVDRYSDAHPERAFKGYGATTYYYSATAEVDCDFLEKKVPLPNRAPHAVSIEVKRKDWDSPYFVVARYDACVQMRTVDGKEVPTPMWVRRGPEQVAKCAEAIGLRAIAPEEVGGLYLKEELEASLVQEAVPVAQVVRTVQPPAPNVAPAVNQAAATDDAPLREGEKPSAPVDLVLPAPVAMPQPRDFGGLFANTEPPPVEHTTTMFPPTPITEVLPPAGPGLVAPTLPPAFIATDADLPAALLVEVPAKEEPVVVPPPPPVALAPALATGDDRLVTGPEYQAFMQRTTTVYHNILQKGLFKGSSTILQSYLLRDTGKTRLKQLTLAEFTTKVSALESATPEDAVVLIKGEK